MVIFPPGFKRNFHEDMGIWIICQKCFYKPECQVSFSNPIIPASTAF